MARLPVIVAGILLLGLLPRFTHAQPTPAGMNFAFGQQAMDKDQPREALEYFRLALVEAEKDGLSATEIARCLDALADAEYKENAFVDAEAHKLRALSLLEKADGQDDPRITQALASLATFYRNRKMLSLARQYHDRAVKIIERAYGPDSQQFALTILNMADYDYYNSPDQSTFAEELYARGLPILEKYDPEGKTFYHIYVGNYADCTAYKNDYLTSELQLTKLIARQEKLAVFGDPMYFEMLCWWADQCMGSNRYALAEQFFQRAWDVQKKYGVKDQREPLDIMFKMAAVYHDQHKEAETEQVRQIILNSIDQVKLIAPRQLIGQFFYHGDQLFHETQYARAKAFYVGAATIMQKAYGPTSTELLYALGRVAFTDDMLGEKAEATSLRARLLKIVMDAPPPHDTDLACDVRDLTNWAVEQQGSLMDMTFLERMLPVISARYRENSKLAVTALGMLADAYQTLQLMNEVESLFVEQIAATQKVYGPGDSQVIRLLLTLANWQKTNGRNGEAQWTVAQAVALLMNAQGLDDIHRAERYLNGAVILWEDDPAQAGTFFQQAITLYEKQYGHDDPHLAAVLFTVANTCGSTESSGISATACWERYLAIQEKTLSAGQREWVDVLPDLIEHYDSREQVEKEEQCRRKLLAIDEQTFSTDDIRILPHLAELRDFWEEHEGMKDVEALIGRELMIKERAMGTNHASLVATLEKLAEIHAGSERKAQAQEELKRALAIADASFWEGDWHVISLLMKYAGVLRSLARTQEAKQVSDRLTALGKKYPELSESIMQQQGND